jgi:periodic tryptophan protein 1
MVTSRDFGNGKVFSAAFSCDAPYLVGMGGSKGNLLIWNVTENAGVRSKFQGRQSRFGEVRMDGQGALSPDVLKEEKDANAVEGDEDDEFDSEEDMEELVEELAGRGGVLAGEESIDE